MTRFADRSASVPARHWSGGRWSGGRAALAILAGVIGLGVLSLLLGPTRIAPLEVLTALLTPDPADFSHHVIVEIRLPRLIAAVGVGAALGICGTLLQSIARNPLADPQILGLNAGAALAVVAATSLLSWDAGLAASLARPWIAAFGALVAFALVLLIAGAGRLGPTPLKVTLCGVAVSALAGSLTSALLLLDEQALQDMRHWLAGDLAGIGLVEILLVAPVILLAGGLAVWLAPQLNVLALGDQVARGLGLRLAALQAAALAAAALLAGAAVTLAGPIGFVGLLVPHLARRLVGADLHRVLPLAAAGGAALLVLADAAARTVLAPQEIATGLVTGAIGAPVFVALVARYFR